MITQKQMYKKIKKLNINYEQENFIVIYLDDKCDLIELEVLFIGGCDSCSICVKTIFRRAMRKNASSLCFAHNHPYSSCLSMKENLEASEADKKAFAQEVSAGELMGIDVLGGMIFNEKGFNSFAFEFADEEMKQ